MTPYLQNRTLFPPQIGNKPSLVLGLVVVIPCYDEPQALRALLSLQKCTLPTCDVEVIVVINCAANADEQVKKQNLETYQQLELWSSQQNSTRLKFHVLLHNDLPPKHAGVGMARKIGMDEAVWRLEKVGQSEGIIACFDADSQCQKNYFLELESFFKLNPKMDACSIHFEHPLLGIEYEDEVYESILLYELHLRYFIHAQKWTGFPFAYQTIGSSMAVRASAYQAQGGMNRRKAGEDFYFLHKFIELGRVENLTSTTVVPSPRISHRVPFGTGKAIGEIIASKENYSTYNFKSFEILKAFFEQIPNFWEEQKINDSIFPKEIIEFVRKENLEQKLKEIAQNTNSKKAFITRFFRWFNAFQLMKFLHFARDHYYPNITINKAIEYVQQIYDLPKMNELETLNYLRKMDKEVTT